MSDDAGADHSPQNTLAIRDPELDSAKHQTSVQQDQAPPAYESIRYPQPAQNLLEGFPIVIEVAFRISVAFIRLLVLTAKVTLLLVHYPSGSSFLGLMGTVSFVVADAWKELFHTSTKIGYLLTIIATVWCFQFAVHLVWRVLKIWHWMLGTQLLQEIERA